MTESVKNLMIQVLVAVFSKKITVLCEFKNSFLCNYSLFVTIEDYLLLQASTILTFFPACATRCAETKKIEPATRAV